MFISSLSILVVFTFLFIFMYFQIRMRVSVCVSVYPKARAAGPVPWAGCRASMLMFFVSSYFADSTWYRSNYLSSSWFLMFLVVDTNIVDFDVNIHYLYFWFKLKHSTAAFALKTFVLKTPESKSWATITRNRGWDLQGPPTNLRFVQILDWNLLNLK